jgi:hypothetical protein
MNKINQILQVLQNKINETQERRIDALNEIVALQENTNANTSLINEYKTKAHDFSIRVSVYDEIYKMIKIMEDQEVMR